MYSILALLDRSFGSSSPVVCLVRTDKATQCGTTTSATLTPEVCSCAGVLEYYVYQYAAPTPQIIIIIIINMHWQGIIVLFKKRISSS